MPDKGAHVTDHARAPRRAELSSGGSGGQSGGNVGVDKAVDPSSWIQFHRPRHPNDASSLFRSTHSPMRTSKSWCVGMPCGIGLGRKGSTAAPSEAGRCDLPGGELDHQAPPRREAEGHSRACPCGGHHGHPPRTSGHPPPPAGSHWPLPGAAPGTGRRPAAAHSRSVPANPCPHHPVRHVRRHA